MELSDSFLVLQVEKKNDLVFDRPLLEKWRLESTLKN